MSIEGFEFGYHLEPVETINGYDVRPGFYEHLGAMAIPSGGVCFTIASKGGTSCELLLFHKGENKPFVIIPIPKSYRVGTVYSIIVFGISVKNLEYAYRFDGPWEPQKGLLFNKDNVLLDPYAKAVAGQREWGVHLNTKGYKARVVKNDFDWGPWHELDTPIEDLVIYELHVRGFTIQDESVEAKGTFAGLKEKIPYLKELGVNAVELMPVFEFDELSGRRFHNGKELVNYWGYGSTAFFAPNTSYANAIEYNFEGREFKELIRELHNHDIEVILDVVFNHTAEGNEEGPFISFKGLDNNIYYMLNPDGNYYNFSGTGNTMNCNHPVVRRMIVDCLRYWVTTYRIDGFRFDLASILGRDESGEPLKNPPLIESLAFDSILSNTKLIAEAWDAGGLYQVGSFPTFNRWSEWNGQYRDTLREYLKGGLESTAQAAKRIAGSEDIYLTEERGLKTSINFLTCHDGFTLYDLYSYNEKHNEANGWDNTDGANDNRSWNCGVEGETTNEEVRALRKRMIKNGAGVLFCSRGTPMFLAGDEFCNTQYGNNNPYCQDNEISWISWKDLEKNKDIFQYFQFMIAFRKEHPVLRGRTKMSSQGLPEISFHSLQPYVRDMNFSNGVVGVQFAGYDEDKTEEDIVLIYVNPHWESQNISLPSLPAQKRYYIVVNTGLEDSVYHEPIRMESEECLIGSRSIIIFVGKKEGGKNNG